MSNNTKEDIVLILGLSFFVVGILFRYILEDVLISGDGDIESVVFYVIVTIFQLFFVILGIYLMIKRPSLKTFGQNLLLFLVGCIISLIFLEIFLQIMQPFGFRVRGNEIVLPANEEYIFNVDTKGVDKTIIHTKNSLGFRGPEPPTNLENYLSIITVGGSTTECFYLSDGKTWQDALSKKLERNVDHLWINNAGLDGHSTFGHLILMEDYIIKLKPNVVLFLVGINDLAVESSRSFDQQILKKDGFYKIITESEIITTLSNIDRFYQAKDKGLVNNGFFIETVDSLEIPLEVIESEKQEHKNLYLKNYKARLQNLIKISRDNGIEPIFLTQPALCGYGVDDVTGVDLAKMQINIRNGELVWEILELYNDVARHVGEEQNVLVIDLAQEMPKSSRYYYDVIHFTNEGAERVGEMIYEHLCPFLEDKFNHYLTNHCDINE